jgi:2-dehydropantoate 2-reductase
MIVIIGGGAVGTILGAYLMAARQPTTLLIRDKDVSAYQTATEMRVDTVNGRPLIAHKPALSTTLDLNGVDYVLICVKFPDLEAALDRLPAEPPSGVTLVCTLNGISAIRRIRERFPGVPVVSMTVMFNGQVLKPLHARITTKAQVLIGSNDTRLLGLFGNSGLEVKRAQGEAATWGKLLINLANAVCALTHTTFKDLFTQTDLRAIYVAVLDEAIGVLGAAGVRYQLPMPVPYGFYRWLLNHGGPVLWWVAKLKNGLQEGAYPSMVADLEQGKKTEVEQLNGEIVRLGIDHRRATPYNTAIVALIHALEGQKRPVHMSPAQLRKHLRA